MPVIQANRVAFGFDSRSANGVGTAGGLTLENYSHIHHFLRLCRQSLVFLDPNLDDWGIGGQNSRDFLARLPALLESSSCGVVVLRGPTNNYGSSNFTYWDSIDTLQQINRLIVGTPGARTGRILYWELDNPRGTATYPGNRLNAEQLVNMQRVRAWLKTQHDGNHISVYDGPAALWVPTSATGDTFDKFTNDGLHDSPEGAYNHAVPGAQLVLQRFGSFQPLVPVNNLNVYNATTNPTGIVNANPTVKNTGTNGTPGTGNSGTIAQGWTGVRSGTASGVATVYSFDADGVQRAVLSGNATGTAARVDFLKQVGLHTQLVPGVTYEGFADIEIDAGALNIGSVQIGLETVDPVNGTVRYWDGDRYLGTSVIHSGADAGLWRIPRYTVPAGMTGASLIAAAYIVDSAASCNLAVRVKAFWLQPVV